MTDVVLVKYDIEQGKTDRLTEWLDSIDSEQDDVSAVLLDEGMLTESMFVDETDRGDVLVWYQEAEDMQRVLDVYEAAEGELVEESKALFDEVLVDGLGEPTDVIEPFVHLVGPNR